MPKHILLIDDDREFLETIKRVCMLSDYKPVTLSSPLQGLNAIKGIQFDLVLTDNQMPEMSGLQFINEYRRLSNSPIILLSATRGLESPADYFLPKPFDINTLLALMDKALTLSKRSSSF